MAGSEPSCCLGGRVGMGSFRTARFGVAVVLAAVVSGCEPAAPVPEPRPSAPAGEASRSHAKPQVMALLPTPSPPVPLHRCPATQGMERTEPLPTSLPVGPTAYWYGAGPLWVDLSLIVSVQRRPVGPDGARYRVRWKAFVDGALTARVRRLDGPGEGSTRVFPAHAEGHAFWTGEVWLPTAGCWLVTANVDGVSLSFVMRS
jgi:hypothetical protein